MFKKLPHNLKVRVYGSEVNGYKIQYCNEYTLINRMMGSIYWSEFLTNRNYNKVFSDLELAKAAAKTFYDERIQFLDKQQANKVHWEFP